MSAATATFGKVAHASHGWIVASPTNSFLGYVSYASPSQDPYGDALALLGLRRPYRANSALEFLAVRETWDSGDPWGSAMSVLGTLCDAAFFLKVPIIESAGYSPGLFLGIAGAMEEEAEDLCAQVELGAVSRHDLELAIRILDRYIDLPAVASRSY